MFDRHLRKIFLQIIYDDSFYSPADFQDTFFSLKSIDAGTGTIYKVSI